jgi:hypothetical protein
MQAQQLTQELASNSSSLQEVLLAAAAGVAAGFTPCGTPGSIRGMQVAAMQGLLLQQHLMKILNQH